jgi:hypothetical protein
LRRAPLAAEFNEFGYLNNRAAAKSGNLAWGFYLQYAFGFDDKKK